MAAPRGRFARLIMVLPSPLDQPLRICDAPRRNRLARQHDGWARTCDPWALACADDELLGFAEPSLLEFQLNAALEGVKSKRGIRRDTWPRRDRPPRPALVPFSQDPQQECNLVRAGIGGQELAEIFGGSRDKSVLDLLFDPLPSFADSSRPPSISIPPREAQPRRGFAHNARPPSPGTLVHPVLSPLVPVPARVPVRILQQFIRSGGLASNRVLEPVFRTT